MRKIISIVLSFGLLFQQSGLLYAAGEINLASYLSQARSAIFQPDVFQPARLRYISYDINNNDFKLLLDKGDNVSPQGTVPEKDELFNYFLIGLALPNDTFWVNLRPDAPENIIDPLLEKTDIGKIFLEADLQLKKDTSSLTSPQNPEGKAYWDKLYKKAGELFGTENITIPTITRPWIVPNEVIVRETEDSAYIYKATLKVMLEADYLQNQKTEKPKNPKTEEYGFSDPRLKELNEYSTQLIRETIIPKLTKEINSSKRYAKLRQVYYSLVLSRWFKQKYSSLGSIRASEHQSAGSSANNYLSLIDSGNLANLTTQEPCDKQSYFQAYQKSFKDGEYNLKETVATPFGQSIRSYISGGISVGNPIIYGGTRNKGNNPAEVTNTLTDQLPPATTASPITLVQMENMIDDKLRGLSDYPRRLKDWGWENSEGKEGIGGKEELAEFVFKEIIPSLEKDGKWYLSKAMKIAEDEGREEADKYFAEDNKLSRVRSELIWLIEKILPKLKTVVEVVQEAKKKLNEYYVKSERDFSNMSVSGLKEAIIDMVEGLSSHEKQEEWYDVASKLSGIQVKVRERMKIYKKELVAFYAGVKENPDVKLNEKEKSYYANEYVRIIEGMNNLDGIIMAAEQAYKLGYSAGSPLTLEEVKEGILEILKKMGSLFSEGEVRGLDKLESKAGKVNSEAELRIYVKYLIEWIDQHLQSYVIQKGKLNSENREFEDLEKRLKNLSPEIRRIVEKSSNDLSSEIISRIGKESLRYFSTSDEEAELKIRMYNNYKKIAGYEDKREGLKDYKKRVLDLISKMQESPPAAGSPLTSVSSAIGAQKDVLDPKRGGIDLTDRMLNMRIERVGSFALSSLVLPEIANVEVLDLDKEYERIQAMVSSSIRPSDTRILEFAAACYYRGEFDQRLAQVSSCVKAAHLADEISGRDSSEALRLATMLPDALYGG